MIGRRIPGWRLLSLRRGKADLAQYRTDRLGVVDVLITCEVEHHDLLTEGPDPRFFGAE